MTLWLDTAKVAKMPGGEVLRLVRDILNDEAFRVEALEDLLVKEGLAGMLNGERIAVVRALHASSDAITLILAQAADDAARHETDARKVRRVFVKAIADQMRAAFLSGEEKGADHGAAA
jgi:hypothetical protein